MSKRYITSGTPVVTSNTVGMIAERGKRSRQDVDALQARLKADRIRKRRSAAQKVRRSRERLYGKNSHLVTVRFIGQAS